MKRAELLSRLQDAAASADVSFEWVREGGQHTLYRYAGQMLAIPRHREINEKLARAILRSIGEAK